MGITARMAKKVVVVCANDAHLLRHPPALARRQSRKAKLPRKSLQAYSPVGVGKLFSHSTNSHSGTLKAFIEYPDLG